jgi:hypothetical protein
MAIRDAGRQKRGGGVKRLSLDGLDGDLSDLVPEGRSLSPEDVFDGAWKKTVWARSIGILEERLRAGGRKEAFEAFRRYALEPPAEGASYAGVAAELGLTPDAVKSHLTRAREELRAIVVEIVREYVDNPEDLALEIRGLLGD